MRDKAVNDFSVMGQWERVVSYAMKQLSAIEQDNSGVKFQKKSDGKGIYLEFNCGKNVSLSDEEIAYQAIEYLQSEIYLINN